MGRRALAVAAVCLALAGCSAAREAAPSSVPANGSATGSAPGSSLATTLPQGSARARALAKAAESQVGKTVGYDAAYVKLSYPGGDVPLDRGTCADVVVRAFRKLGIDLQVDVHEDMAAHFDAYPRKWGLRTPDANIDHRRVPNLRAYFKRRGFSVPATNRGSDYRPGDIVTWELSGHLSHVGIVSTVSASDGSRHCVVHNIGAGTQIEDCLFEFPITGHYRPL